MGLDIEDRFVSAGVDLAKDALEAPAHALAGQAEFSLDPVAIVFPKNEAFVAILSEFDREILFVQERPEAFEELTILLRQFH